MIFKLIKQTGGGIDSPPSEQYRHEFKYVIDWYQLQVLKSKLPTFMMLDSHAKRHGHYMIRSLYFDDYENSCYYENENGTDPREKFRIRMYNGSSDYVSLECKRKEAGKTLKKSCPISVNQVNELIHGGQLHWDNKMDPLIKKLYIKQELNEMKPVVIVEYERIPFVYRDGNVRITLDLGVRTSAAIDSFLDPITLCRPIMPMGMNLLEVKYDNFLPDHIYHLIGMKGLRQTAFSKYYLCRKFGGII